MSANIENIQENLQICARYFNAIISLLGVTSMAGIQAGLWSVHGGNQRIPEEMILMSKVNLIRSKVVKVILTSPAPTNQYRIQAETSSGKISEEDYDIVVVAAPLNDDIAGVSFVNFPKDITFPQHYHRTVATFLKGTPNMEYFKLSSSAVFPIALLNSKKGDYFNSIGQHEPVNYTSDQASNSVFKIFSQTPVTEEQLKLLFKSHESPKVVDWLAYPDYSCNEKELPSFELYDQLYYVNGIEMASSALEMSAIGGRNVALLAYSRWQKHVEKIDSIQALRYEDTHKEEL